jgi:hypothetical protein
MRWFEIYKHPTDSSIVGIQLFYWNNISIAVWYMPKGTKLSVHKHPRQNIELIPLVFMGRVTLNRKRYNEKIQSVDCKMFKAYSTPEGYYHFFSNRTGFIVYLNVITWLNSKPLHPFKASETYGDSIEYYI